MSKICRKIDRTTKWNCFIINIFVFDREILNVTSIGQKTRNMKWIFAVSIVWILVYDFTSFSFCLWCWMKVWDGAFYAVRAGRCQCWHCHHYEALAGLLGIIGRLASRLFDETRVGVWLSFMQGQSDTCTRCAAAHI